ncbi:MAG: Rha family transcriptional regulator [Selenomonadaceae bacterium]|nr:Rha family transcriptional regulator [Selenomonadaceae bacterium]
MKKAQLVSLENNQALTSSRIVADKFDKQHQHVMRDIRSIIEQAEDASKIGPMFHEATYEDKYGRQKPMYLMNRDGFSLLAMGFTGKKALQFKLKFIDEFNRMEAKLKSLAIAGRDDRWLQTRLLGKQTRKLLTQAIKALEEYFEARGKIFPAGYLYGHLTNLIQNALGIEKGGRDNCSVRKLNQLDQTEDMAGGVILRSLADK